MKSSTPFFLTLLLAVAVVLTACTERAPPVQGCTMEAKICPDGSAVGRSGPNCEFAPCPATPEPSAAGTFKEYKSQDPDMCARMKFTCDGDEYFGDETGCGCVRQHNDAAVTLCSADVNEVCGWSDQTIQCFAYPCAGTYSNICMASIVPTVAYTTPGACPKVGTVPTPGAVSEKYASLSAQYGDSMGAKIEQCSGNSETFFVVSGSGGFSGEDAYYDNSGKLLGTYVWDDVVVVGEAEAKPPRDKSEYDCTTLESTTPDSTAGRVYVEHDADKCAATDWICQAPGTQQFYDSTGCGCEPIGEGKLQAIDCTDPRPTACTKEYMPVCGQKGDASSTFGNKCSACANTKVISYTQGACGATDGSAGAPGGQMPVKKPAVDCTEPRPEICTLEYNPVCGQKDDGTSSTYGNKCGACADKDVLSYTADACASDFATYSFQPKQCQDTPWQAWYAGGAGGMRWVKAPTDVELITAYYGQKDIDASDATKVDSGMMTCEACDVCATSYSFSLRVMKDQDTKVLTDDGWTLKAQNQ